MSAPGSKTIDAATLADWMAQKREFVLIDVSLAEDYEAEHLPGALNARIYELTFLQQIGDLEPLKRSLLDRVIGLDAVDHSEPLVVYGSGEESLASATAAEKLVRAGFSQIHDFRGGLAEWKRAGHAVEGTGPREDPEAPGDRVYQVDPMESEFEWTGRSLGGKHNGTVKIAAGELTIRDGQPMSGEFSLDMESFEVADIGDTDMRNLLIDHLKSDDFFDVGKFPTARFEIDRSEPIPDAPKGMPDTMIFGRLELKGVEQPVEFTAATGSGPDGTLVARANFDIDRTRWNVIYGSGRFYKNLGRHLVNDLITLDLKIVAR